MGFDVNSANSKPVIREAATMHNDGGGGNLGYFEGGEHKKKKQTEESIFSNKEETDSFSKGTEKEPEGEDFSLTAVIAKIIFTVKEQFKKLFR